jgi:hypothetical protein
VKKTKLLELLNEVDEDDSDTEVLKMQLYIGLLSARLPIAILAFVATTHGYV